MPLQQLQLQDKTYYHVPCACVAQITQITRPGSAFTWYASGLHLKRMGKSDLKTPDSSASTLPPMYVSDSSRCPLYIVSAGAVCLFGHTILACTPTRHCYMPTCSSNLNAECCLKRMADEQATACTSDHMCHDLLGKPKQSNLCFVWCADTINASLCIKHALARQPQLPYMLLRFACTDGHPKYYMLE